MHHGEVIADGTTEEIRNRVGGALICQTSLSWHDVYSLPGVRSVETSGRMFTVLSNNAPQTLRSLLQCDATLCDLEVKKPSLSEAFAALTDASMREAA